VLVGRVAGMGQWCSAVGARGSSKAADAACSAVFDADTAREL
jgi:hypothetical protein